jgi:hypothetical protein
MFRVMLPAVAVVGVMLMPAAGRADTAVEPKSVTVNLLFGDRMFPGPGADAINKNCLACHSAGMVLNQPALSKSAWTAEVNKMINAYKAPVASEDVAAIVDYLTRTKGTN